MTMYNYYYVFGEALTYIMPVILILVAGSIWWNNDLSRKEIRNKYEAGIAYLVEGRVIKVNSHIARGYKRLRKRYYATVEYTDKRNHTRTGVVEIGELEFVNPGSTIKVVFDPQTSKIYRDYVTEKPSSKWTIIAICIVIGAIICLLDQIGVF